MDRPSLPTPLALSRVRTWFQKVWGACDPVKVLLGSLPFLCLVGYGWLLPVPLPSLFLPERTYLALGADAPEPLLRTGGPRAVVVLPDRLVPVPPSRSGLETLRGQLPMTPALDPVLTDLQGGLGPFMRARLVMTQPPLPVELEALTRAAAQAPLAIEVKPQASEVPVQALGVRHAPAEKRIAFDLLLGPEARACRRIEIRTRGSRLFQAAGKDLPQDDVLRLSVDRAEAEVLRASFTDASGRMRERTLHLGADLDEEPKVLLVSEKAGKRSFIEALYPSRRVTLREAASLDLLAYELVVLDGLPMGALQGRLKDGLMNLVNRRAGSVLFVADAPAFGKKGDNPELEALLPVTLLPRSLKDLPDLSVLLLIDVSGSMFGDKLSLAKVTGLELLRNLKPSDQVGMMLFSDERQWVYEFQANSRITAAPTLAPLTAGGGTDLYPALSEGLTRLGQQSIKAKHAVLVTDGVTRPADFQSLAERARSLGISLSTMGVGEDVNRPLLERLALQTGGRYYPVSGLDAIPGLLFEDRMSEARAIFSQGRVPVVAMNGERVTQVDGMAQYTPTSTASVLFASDVGDPLLASREFGNRAVVFFGSDLYGSYTSAFFGSSMAAGVFKDRLDALFARRPAQVRTLETARGITVLVQSDSLLAPSLLASREGQPPREVAFRRTGPEGWAAEIILPVRGLWHASILDRGGSLARFRIAANGGLGGVRSDAATALAGHATRLVRWVRVPWLWLGAFLASSLACTVMLRVKR